MSLSRLLVAMMLVLGFTSAAAAEKIAPTFTQEQARKIALARVPGTIVHEKLKQKQKPPVYSIKIQPRDGKPAGMLIKVEVDGITGQVLKAKPVKPRQAKPDAE